MLKHCRISRPYRDAQDRLLWRDKTSCMYLAHHELESDFIIIIIKLCWCKVVLQDLSFPALFNVLSSMHRFTLTPGPHLASCRA